MGLFHFIFALSLTGMTGNDEGKWDWQMTQKIGTNIPCISTTDLCVKAHALTTRLWLQLNVKYSHYGYISGITRYYWLGSSYYPN